MATVHSLGGKPVAIAGYWLGFALGGFFDGILLHQILQWHHLLSGIDTDPMQDIGMQIMADGLFHAFMYLIALIGLWKLFRSRPIPSGPFGTRLLLANILIGFGAWHIVDSVLSHWILGIHRIRMDAENPLLWDIGWFVVFGISTVIAGFILRSRADRNGGSSDRNHHMPHLFALVTVVAGLAAAQPLPDSGSSNTVIVVLRPEVTSATFLSSLDKHDARIMWTNARGNVWAITTDRQTNLLTLYKQGAMYVSGTLTPAGCVAWLGVRTKANV